MRVTTDRTADAFLLRLTDVFLLRSPDVWLWRCRAKSAERRIPWLVYHRQLCLRLRRHPGHSRLWPSVRYAKELSSPNNFRRNTHLDLTRQCDSPEAGGGGTQVIIIFNMIVLHVFRQEAI